jgi:hypothetical protein
MMMRSMQLAYLVIGDGQKILMAALYSQNF